METTTHLHLKRLAVGYLRALGCPAFATEVRCPIARYRVDVAGYLDREHSEPVGWGRGDLSLHEAVEAPSMSSRPAHRMRLLRNIAVAASRASLRVQVA